MSNFDKTLGNLVEYRNLPNYEEHLNVIRSSKKLNLPFSVRDKNTFVGIEVEVEQVFRTASILPIGDGHLWNNTEDNSLRNNGREFVSVPIKGDDIPFAVSTLFSTFQKEKNCQGFEFTDRTSIHVHMNMRDCSLVELANLILTYILVEPLLYKFVGGGRDKNIFCVPITESNLLDSLQIFFSNIETRKVDALSIKNNWLKYTGLNLLPLQNYGTVEFRHLVGTSDTEKIGHWINFILAVKQYAKKSKYENLKSTILKLNTSSDYMAVLVDIFGDDAHLLDVYNLQEDMENTSILIKDIFTKSSNKLIETAMSISLDEVTTEKLHKSSKLYSRLQELNYFAFFEKTTKKSSFLRVDHNVLEERPPIFDPNDFLVDFGERNGLNPAPVFVQPPRGGIIGGGDFINEVNDR